MEVLSPSIDLRRTIGTWNDVSDFLGLYEGEVRLPDTDETMGYLRAYVFDSDGANAIGYSPMDALDAVTSATVPYIALYSFEEAGNLSPAVLKILGEDFASNDRILILDRIELLPKYRGHGVGLLCMRTLIRHLGIGCRLVAIKPFPLQFEPAPLAPDERGRYHEMKLAELPKSRVQATRKLKNHYSRLGFKAVRGTELMILDLYEDLPETDDVEAITEA